MPETANQGAASQPDLPTTSYTVTVVEQRIYQIPVSGPIEYPDRNALQAVFDYALTYIGEMRPDITINSTVEWRRPSGHTATWEAPQIPNEPSEPEGD